MANLIRTAKSGSHWTINDLESYNVQIVQENFATFFGMQELPEPTVDPELLVSNDAQAMKQDCNAELINLLDLAMIPSFGESAVLDFTVELFATLGYVRRERMARTWKDLTLLVCGEYRNVKTDVCIFDCSQNDILLLVQEDKRAEDREPVGPQAQLVAEAIAAFEENNNNRIAAGLKPLTKRAMPGIVMMGTSPTFHKIPVTNNLLTHVHHGTYPPDVTRATFCQPPVPRPARRRSEGMKPLDNRRQILRCFEAFKTVVGI